MNISQLQDFLNEAIQLELNIARLYKLFGEHLKVDYHFWFTLEIEEKNHAALLKASREFISANRFPNSILPENVELLINSNQQVNDAIDKFLENPTRESAFNLAFDIEKNSGEAHYQLFMQSETDDRLTNIFQQLNRADKDHASRILQYWQDAVHNPDSR